MIVYLVPAGRGRFELYSETRDEAVDPAFRPEGRFRRWVHTARVRWSELVENSRRGSGTGRLVRWRDAFVARLAETVAEQRTLWALADRRAATARFPSTLDAVRAESILRAVLARARRHHARWFGVDLALFIASGAFALIPGPNLIAYYLAFRVVGHVQAWRGARQAMDRTSWACEAAPELAELALLVDVPRDLRASRVAEIEARLNLERLSAFFDRVAAPSAR